MRNGVLEREFDKLVEGRLKKLPELNLKEKLYFRENIFDIANSEEWEVFGE